MMKQHSAQIYLADKRKQRQAKGYNCWSTFNNEKESIKNDFGSLFLLDYQILAPNHKTTFVTPAHCLFYILPLYGGVFCIDELQNESMIITQQSQQFFPEKEFKVEMINPFEENVSFLIIGFNAKSMIMENELVTFDFSVKNRLIPLFNNKIAKLALGQFDGRKDAVYQLKNKENGIFVYIIQGAFEFENRLLETGDALRIQNIDIVEWETLSENAMLLLIEIPLE